MAGSWRLAAAKTAALWLFLLALYMPVISARNGGDLGHTIADAGSTGYSILLGMLLFLLFRATIGARPMARGVVLVAAVVVLALANIGIDILYNDYVEQAIDPRWTPSEPVFWHRYVTLLNYLCVFAVNLALFQVSFVLHRHVRDERRLAAVLVEAQQAQLTAQTAQLEALRLQLNPHFLFNTLNAISAMIVTARVEEAETMVERLAAFLRAAATLDPGELVPLSEELALLDDYLHIEQARFGERLHVEVDSGPDTLSARVPALLLQPLIENAIKYAVSPSRTPVKLVIRSRRHGDELCVTVSDDGCGDDAVRAKGIPRTGVGLRNVRQRLTALYGPAGVLATGRTDRGFEATVRLPANGAVRPRVVEGVVA